MRTRILKRATLVATLVAAALAGCGDSRDEKLRLLHDDKVDDSEQARLRQLQTMKVVSIADATETESEELVPIGTFDDINSSHLASSIYDRCEADVGLASGGTCAGVAFNAAVTLCSANLFLEAATFRAKPLKVHDSSGQKTYLIGAQSSPVNAALSRYASYQAYDAFSKYLQTLRWATGSDTLYSCPLTDAMSPELTLAEIIGAGFVDAYTTYREAIDVFTRNTVASSDAQLSSTASLTQGTSWAISASALSRAAAAHSLVGGDPGLFGSTTVGGTDWCAVPEPTPGVRAAIEVFREAGTDPADILMSEAELPLADLLESRDDCPGTCTGTPAPQAPNYSVRERLADKWGQEDTLLLSASPTLFEFFNLTKADFQAAREYLASEIKAFSRSKTAILPPPPKAGGGTVNVPLFAGVATLPPVRPPEYFAALAKPGPYRPQFPTGTVANPYDLDLSSFVDWALSSAAQELGQTLSPTLASDPTARAQLLDPIAALVAESEHERVGRLTVNHDSMVGITVYANGLSALDEARIVRGEDGLACATAGSIEGAVCDLDSPDITVSTLPAQFSGYDVFQHTVYGSWQPEMDETFPQRFYLVRRKPSSSGGKFFEALLGFTVYQPDYTESYPIVPSAERRAGDLLAPDRNWCSRTRVSCAGVEMDARIPLEDELSDDSNGVENSWRHYVDLARRSAKDADALGEAVLSAGEGVTSTELTIAGRAEQAMEEVQKLCGADIDLEQLRSILSANGGLEKLRTETTCTTDSECTSPQGADQNVKYHCRGGFCVGDLLATISAAADKDPAIQRIAACVDPGTVQDFVTLGSQDLCVWMKGGDLTQVCADQSPAFPCPILASDTDEPCSQLLPPGWDLVLYPPAPPISTKLGYFDFANEGAGLPHPVCESIRKLRRSRPDNVALSEIISSEFFHPSAFYPFARQIRFEPRFNSHSAVLLGAATVFQTGDEWGGLSFGWPCAPRSGVACTAGDTSLMCAIQASNQCATPTLRAPINRRLLDAVTALRGMVTANGNTATEYPTGVPGMGNYVSVNPDGDLFLGNPSKFTRSRNGKPPVVVHEMVNASTQNVDSPWASASAVDKLTYYFVLSSDPALREAWREPGPTIYTTPQDDSDPYSGPPTFVVITTSPRNPHGKGVGPDSYFAGLSTAGNAAIGGFKQYLASKNASLGLGDSQALWWTPKELGVGVAFTYFTNTGVQKPADTDRAALDALELACEVARGSQSPLCDLSDPPDMTANGWPAAKQYLNCAATEIQRQGALTIFAGFPVKAIDALRKESKVGAFPALGGAYGAAVSRLRAGLVDLAEVTPLIASELRSFGTDLEHVETSVALTEIQEKKNEIQFMATAANQTAECIASGLKTVGLHSAVKPGQVAAAVVTCVNSAAQIAFAAKLKDLGNDQANLEAEQARLSFRQRFETRAQNVQNLATRLTKASDEIDASLAEIESLRDQARRALYRALLDSSTVGKKQATLLSIGKARFATAQRRYEAARQNAVLAAFIAKRSVETRLGVRLSSLKEDLPLVAAPHSWESTVCSSSGVSFDDIVREGGAKDYADAYIGDYVDKLENVVESYRLVNNFHEGTDTAVVSLKDDFNRIKKDCPTSVNNLLYHAGDPSAAGVEPVGSAVTDFPNLPENKWALAGCLTGEPDCVGISVLGGDAAPFVPSVQKLSSVQGFRVSFGPESGTCSGTCGYQQGAYLAQRLDLVPGKYRLSWHTRQPPDQVPAAVELDGVGLATLSGPSVTAVGMEGALDVDPDPGATLKWHRRWQLFEVSTTGTYAVLIGPSGSAGGIVDLAGIMLENVPGAIAADQPATFANTGDTLTRMLPTCVDTDGGVFRATKWRRGCVKLCSDGFAASCDGAAAQTYCYRETLVSFSQADIDSGRIFGASGIARGNFNYRIERIGVNFTGTGLRNCESSSSPQSCAGSGYWTYSLQHGGPYHVRNYTGQDVPVQLFTGNIEHARGLAAERYLTNPMSSADNELMSTFMRREFQGRPLDGTFVLRVWEEPGLNFDAMEDVQLALEYRYWTRFK